MLLCCSILPFLGGFIAAGRTGWHVITELLQPGYKLLLNFQHAHGKLFRISPSIQYTTEGIVLQECNDAGTQTAPHHQVIKRPCETTAVQTLPLPEALEVVELRAQAAELQVELQRAVEALEQRLHQDQVTSQQAATAVATAESAATEQVEAAHKAADNAVAVARCSFLPAQLLCICVSQPIAFRIHASHRASH